MPIERAFPVLAVTLATTGHSRLPGEATVSLSWQFQASHIVVDASSGSNTLRLPLWFHTKKGEVADERLPLPEFGPAMITVLNRTGGALTVMQPARSAQESHYDRAGTLHSFAPPDPGPAIGVLAGTHRWSSHATFGFGGTYPNEYFFLVGSDDWEPAEASNG